MDGPPVQDGHAGNAGLGDGGEDRRRVEVQDEPCADAAPVKVGGAKFVSWN